jgi:hypothetical protein
MHRHFMEVPALLEESREAYMQKGDDRRTDGRLSGLVLNSTIVRRIGQDFGVLVSKVQCFGGIVVLYNSRLPVLLSDVYAVILIGSH